MRTFSILLGLALTAFCASAGAATLFAEDFNYTTGMLETASGGIWDTWENNPAVPDGVAFSKMLIMDGQGIPEVVAYYQNALPAIGTMNAKFDFFVHEEGLTETDSYFVIGGGTEATSKIDYNIWAFQIDFGAASNGTSTELAIWDLDGPNGGGDYGFGTVLASGLTLDSWHTVELIAKQNVVDPLANDVSVADGEFQVWLDGNLVMNWTNFGNNSVNGVNSVDIWSNDDGEEHDFFAYDKIYIEATEPIVPEPGMFALAGLGLLALIRRRK